MILYRRQCGNDCCRGRSEGIEMAIEMAIERLVLDIARYGVLALRRDVIY